MLSTVNTSFVEWLNSELEKRGWSQSELARNAGLSRGSVSHVINGSRQPGNDFCEAIARAFHIPVEEVFQIAGILPARPTEQPPGFLEWMDLFLSADENQREEMLEYARFQASRRRKKPAENR